MSQNDTINLTVDAANNGTTATEAYTSYSNTGSIHTYIGADHAPDMQNTLKLYRTEPSASGNFKGYLDTKISFGQDFTVPGVDGVNSVRMGFASLQIRVPVGVSEAQILHLRQRVVAILDTDTIMGKLNYKLEI